MWLHRVWLTMAWLALVAGLAAVHWHVLFAPEPVYVAVSACVAGLFALGGMCRPWFFLAVAVALWMTSPTVFDSGAHELFEGCYLLGWGFGALAGWFIRNSREECTAPAGRTRSG